MKLLPIGISDFKELIQGNFIYVDKTEYIYKLISSGKYYFLSRPRRFGKSLLLSTIRYLFQGYKDLFKNLYIQDKWNWDETYPILKIDLSHLSITNEKEFEDQMELLLKEIGKEFKYNYQKKYKANGNFHLLIKKCYENYNKKVVILIDEYDKVILDNIENTEKAQKIR